MPKNFTETSSNQNIKTFQSQPATTSIDIPSMLITQAKEGSFFILIVAIVVFWFTRDYIKKGIESYVEMNLAVVRALRDLKESTDAFQEFEKYARPRVDHIYEWVKRQEFHQRLGTDDLRDDRASSNKNESEDNRNREDK